MEWVSEVSEGCSVVSDSLRPHGLYSPWNSPGQNTGVAFLFSRESSQCRDQTGSLALQADSLPTELGGKLMESISKGSEGGRRQRPVYLLPGLPPRWPQVGSGTASSLAVSLLTPWLDSLQWPFSSVSSVSGWNLTHRIIFSVFTGCWRHTTLFLLWEKNLLSFLNI